MDRYEIFYNKLKELIVDKDGLIIPESEWHFIYYKVKGELGYDIHFDRNYKLFYENIYNEVINDKIELRDEKLELLLK